MISRPCPDGMKNKTHPAHNWIDPYDHKEVRCPGFKGLKSRWVPPEPGLSPPMDYPS
jgi:hypothetical protein